MHDDTMDDELTFADEDELAFADEDESEDGLDEHALSPWKILLVDDEPNVHQVTKLALDDLKVDNRGVEPYPPSLGKKGKRASKRKVISLSLSSMSLWRPIPADLNSSIM